jgi:hypothetical protein
MLQYFILFDALFIPIKNDIDDSKLMEVFPDLENRVANKHCIF